MIVDIPKENPLDRKRPDGKPKKLPVDIIPVADEPPQKKVGKLAALWAKTATHKRNIGIMISGIGYAVLIWNPAGWFFVGLGGIISGVGWIDDLIRKNKAKNGTGNNKIDWQAIITAIIEFLKSLLKRS